MLYSECYKGDIVLPGANRVSCYSDTHYRIGSKCLRQDIPSVELTPVVFVDGAWCYSTFGKVLFKTLTDECTMIECASHVIGNADPMIDTYTFSGKKNRDGEYVLRCYRNGKRHANGDYFTQDKTDALNTLEMCNKGAESVFWNAVASML